MDHGDQMKERGIGFEGRREKKEKEAKREKMTEEGEKRERTHSKVASNGTNKTRRFQIRSAISPDKCSQLKITCQRERRST